jgi:hypothetical protein
MAFEVLIAVGISDFVFWVMTPFSVVSGYTYFGEKSAISLTLVIIHKTTRCHGPEDQYPVGTFAVHYNKSTLSLCLFIPEGIQRIFEQTDILTLLGHIS